MTLPLPKNVPTVSNVSDGVGWRGLVGWESGYGKVLAENDGGQRLILCC